MTEPKNRDFYRWTRDKQKAFEEQVKEANDSKFPKSGGTINGPIIIEPPAEKIGYQKVVEFKVKYSTESQQLYNWSFTVCSVSPLLYLTWFSNNLLAVCPTLGLFPATTDTRFTLGYYNSPWPNVYTKKLNNGADLELPTKAGTVALLSDIEDILKKYNLIPETKE